MKSRFAKIRWNILLRLTIVVGALFVGLHFAADSLILSSFRTLEIDFGRASLTRVLNVLDADIEGLGSTATNESRWDDAYEFMRRPSAEFIKSDMATLVDLNLDLLLYLDPDGRVVYGKQLNLETGLEERLPTEIQTAIVERGSLWQLATPQSRKQGLLLVARRPLLLAARPIITSEGMGPVRGALVFGRWLEADTLARLSQKVKRPLTLAVLDDDQRQIEPPRVFPRDEHLLLAQTQLQDVDSRPVLLLTVEMPRDIYRQGRQSVDYFILCFLGGTIFSVLLIYLLIDRVLTTREESQSKFEYLAYHDPLTRLPNRALLQEFMAKTLDNARREQHCAALLFMDLDRFKQINDTYGHSFGDQLLVDVARWLGRKLRQGDMLARIGGDEFIIFLPNLKDQIEARVVAQKLLGIGNHPFEIRDNQVFISSSIGIAVFPEDGADLETLQKMADLALYEAKRKGRNLYQFISFDLNQRAQRQSQMETAMRRAIQRNEFYLVYQPQVDLVAGKIFGAEVLLRWHDPAFGEISPDTFIPIAEESGLIHILGEWVLTAACRQMCLWQQAGHAPRSLSINFSGLELKRTDFIEKLDEIISATGIDPQCLEFELTESVLMDDVDAVQRLLEQLRERKISLSIDDFGIGYSSLSYLRHFPIQRVKIDRSFVRAVEGSHKDLAIIKAIIAMAASLELKVTAEGVETEGQLNLLRDHGCTEIQGYFFGRPMSADALQDCLLAGIDPASRPA